MPNGVTREHVEQLAVQLPPQEQLELVAHIVNQLNITLPLTSVKAGKQEQVQRQRLQLAEELLVEVADIEDDSQGTSDAAITIRKMRDERIFQICRRDA